MTVSKLSKSQWIDFGLTVLFFCLLALGQLERWQVTATVAIYGHDVVLVVLLLLKAPWWNQQLRTWKTRYNLRQDWPVLLLLGWAGIGWLLSLLSGVSILTAGMYLVRLLVYLAFNWQLLHATWWPQVVPWIKPQERVLASYWLLGLFVMYFGFLQYLLVPDIRFMGTFGWDVHLYRLVGVQLDPNITGALLILTLLLTLSLSFLRPVIKIILSFVITASIALTYSRSTFGATVVGLISWALLKRSQKWQVWLSLGLIASLLVMIVALPRPGGEGVRLERTASGEARVTAAQSVLTQMSPANWVVGRGIFVPGNYTQQSEVILGQHAQQADNIIILLLTGLGVGGMVLLVYLFYRYRRALGQLSPLAIASILAILAHSQFNNTLFQPFVWLIITAIVLTAFKYQGKES